MLASECDWRGKMISSLFQTYESAEKDSCKERGKEEVTVSLAACAILLEIARNLAGLSNNDRLLLVRTLKSSFGLTDNLAMDIVQPRNKQEKRGIDHTRLCPATRETHALKAMDKVKLEDRWRLSEMVDKTFSREEKLEVTSFIWSLVLGNPGFSKRGEILVTMEMASLLRVPQDEIFKSQVICAQFG